MNGIEVDAQSHEIVLPTAADWAAYAAGLDWTEPATIGEQPGSPVAGAVNACWNCVDRHVAAGRGDRAAIVYDAPLIPFRKTISFAELQDEVAVFAAVLAGFGIGAGTCVALYLPMIPRAHVAILASLRIGARVVVVPGGAPADQLAACLDAYRPKVLLTASCGLTGAGVQPFKPLVDEAIGMAQAKPEAVLVWQRPRLAAQLLDGRDHDWEALIEAADEAGEKRDCLPIAADEPMIVGPQPSTRLDTGGTLLALAWASDALYGLRPGDVMWSVAASPGAFDDAIGALLPLLSGAATLCFEGEAATEPAELLRACQAHDIAFCELMPDTLRALIASDEKTSVGGALRNFGVRRDGGPAGMVAEQTVLPVANWGWRDHDGWTLRPASIGNGDKSNGDRRMPLPGGLALNVAPD